MSLTREQILDEMGLTPRWKLREEPSVMRRGKRAGTASTPVAEYVPHQSHAVQRKPEASALSAPLARTVPETGFAESRSPASVPDAARPGRIAQLDWPALRQEIQLCRACSLCAERQQAVPGVGAEEADWLFVGEGPGAEEDERGEPFVGQAGRLLDAMLSAINIRRGEDVYIANAVKCRPPGNRTPEASEMAACRPYLERQIMLLQPRLIVLLGRAAVHSLLGLDASLSSLRGKPLSYRLGELEIPVVVTYHPAYLLRNLPDKSKAWEDLCRARALMSLAKSARAGSF